LACLYRVQYGPNAYLNLNRALSVFCLCYNCCFDLIRFVLFIVVCRVCFVNKDSRNWCIDSCRRFSVVRCVLCVSVRHRRDVGDEGGRAERVCDSYCLSAVIPHWSTCPPAARQPIKRLLIITPRLSHYLSNCYRTAVAFFTQ